MNKNPEIDQKQEKTCRLQPIKLKKINSFSCNKTNKHGQMKILLAQPYC